MTEPETSGAEAIAPPDAGRLRAAPLLLPLAGANLAAWAWAWWAFHDRPTLLASALLAWVFGLRHALDADHIAAIDNVVRKLMRESQPARGVGLWFSLGHSTVVVAASAAVALLATATQGRLEAARAIGGVVGTVVSALFLLAIGLANLAGLRAQWRGFQNVRRAAGAERTALARLADGAGVLARLLRPLLGGVRRARGMYPIGVLFGLGFDTATEIGLLGIAAAEAAHGVSAWQVMVFPALFTAGMALVDTADSVLMVGAYGWAFVDPARKLWYNLTITLASALVALLIGGIEALGLLGGELALRGPFWAAVTGLNDRLGMLGGAVVALFVLAWGGSALVYRRLEGAG